MHRVTALALSSGILAVAATYLCLGTSFGLQPWALLIGWAGFFHCGGGARALLRSAAANLWGVIVAVSALTVIAAGGGSVLFISAVTGVAVFVLVLGARIPAPGAIPAGICGYAGTMAFLLLTGVAIGDIAASLHLALLVALSLIAGNLFGFLSERIAGALTAPGG